MKADDAWSVLSRFSDFAPHLASPSVLTLGARGFEREARPRAPFRALSPMEVTLPASARGVMRMAVPGTELWIELSDDDARDVVGVVHGASVVFAGTAPSLDVVHVAEDARAEEIRLLRGADAPTRLRWSGHTGPAVADVRVRGTRVEVVDRDGHVRIESEPMFAVDAHGVRREVVPTVVRDGERFHLVADVDVSGLTYPVAVDPAWTATSSMSVAHMGHTATLLPSGKVLVAPGPETYDPALRFWQPAGTMVQPRQNHAATGLASGKVLVAGGLAYDASVGRTLSVSVAEEFDSGTTSWSSVNAMAERRAEHTATRLPSGKVIVTGGYRAASPTLPELSYSTTEIFDPATGTWTAGPPMAYARMRHTATLLPSGRVLVVGNKTSELFDPVANSWSYAGPNSATTLHTATLLDDGRVVIAGGTDGGSPSFSNVDIFDSKTGTWSVAKPLAQGRFLHTATLLANGRVLVTGGNLDAASSVTTSTAEVFDPKTGEWSSGGVMSVPRNGHTAALLGDGSVLVAGGGAPSVIYSSAELFIQAKNGAACVSAGECASGECVDGVCCDRACGGACEACDVVGNMGVCTVVPKGPPHGTRTACAGSGTCGGSCDGTSTACAYPSMTTVCGSTCTAGVTTVSSCDGAGTCHAGAPTNCAPFLCAPSGTACLTGCTSDADCVGTAACVSGACKTRVGAGKACSLDGECTTGHCADGVCCDVKCDGACEACAESGSVGTCTAVTGTPRAGRSACIGAGTSCGGTCDGTHRGTCTYPPTTSRCDACAAGALTQGTCDGAGECHAGDVKSCAPYLCGGPSACFASCTTNDQCAAPAVCASGSCVAPMGAHCSDDGLSSVLADGTTIPCGAYRCDAATGRCRTSCASATDCAPNDACTLGHCAPTVAHCSDDGTASIAADGTTTPCDPYGCDPTSGACRQSCTSSAQCASGNVCDEPTKTCEATANSSPSGGCEYSLHRGGDGVSKLAVVAAGIVLLGARRRRNRAASMRAKRQRRRGS